MMANESFCRTCRQIVKPTKSGRCPECGRDLEAEKKARAREEKRRKKGRLIPCLLLTLFAFSFAGALEAQQRASVELPRIACAFGLCGRTPISVVTNVPFYSAVMAGSVEIADCVPPGTRLHDSRGFAFEYAELPIAVALFSDSLCTQGVGFAATVLRMNRGQPATFVVEPYAVRRFDGGSPQMSQVSPYPATPSGASYEVSFPWSTLSRQPVQFVNGTNFSLVCRLSNDQREIILGAGGVATRTFYLVYEGTNIPVSVSCDLRDAGRRVGFYETQFSLQKDGRGPRAHQVFVSMQDIRRAY